MAPESFGCDICLPAVPARSATLGLKSTALLIDESHFRVSIRSCAACGQPFLSIFTERVDWVNGEDPQRTTLMPLTPAEVAPLLTAGDALDLTAMSELAKTRRFLRDDWPSHGSRSVYYSTGTLIGPHD